MTKFLLKVIYRFYVLCTDVSPHLIFKNGPHPTLWPQDVPFPGEENDNKNDIAAYGGDDPSKFFFS